jgi:glutamate dehydrogenase
MLIDIGQLAAVGSSWFLRSRRLHDDLATTIAHFEPGVRLVASHVNDLLQGDARGEVAQAATRLEAEGVPAALARRIASLAALAGALDIVETAAAAGEDVVAVASVYFDLGARLGLDWLAQRVNALPAEGHWQTLAKLALRDDLADLQRVLAHEVLAAAGGSEPSSRIAAWEAANRTARERAARVVQEVRDNPAADLAMLSVALRELRNLAGGSGAAQSDSGSGPG